MKDNLSPENLIDRLNSPTPDFWKKVRNVMLTIGAVGGAIISVPASVVVLPGVVLTAAGYMVAIGIVGTSLASLTK